jgi:sulfonate transport system permease protein
MPGEKRSWRIVARLQERELSKPYRFPSQERFGKKGSGASFCVPPFLIRSIVPLLVVILWEVLSRAGLVADNLLPAPATVAVTILEMVQDGSLWSHVGITLYRVLIGFVIGTAAGVVFGALVGVNRTVEQLFDTSIQALRSVPSIAWVPLFILWFSIGESSKITLIAVGVFFPVYLNTVSGIRNVDRKLIEVGQVYRFSAYEHIRRIVLPASLPSFLVGLRSGLGLGWMFVVAAELMGASEGLGYLLVFGQNTSAPQLIISSLILFAVLGKCTDAVLKGVERKALHWQDGLPQKR